MECKQSCGRNANGYNQIHGWNESATARIYIFLYKCYIAAINVESVNRMYEGECLCFTRASTTYGVIILC